MQLTLTNKNGDTLDLLNSRSYFVLYKAEAMHGIETDISESESPFIDGVTIESVRALPRSIELGFKLVGKVQTAIDYITSFIKSKQYVTLEEVNDDGRDVVITGIATIPPYSRMLQTCELTLTIYCGQPYWEDAETIVKALTMYLDLLYFPEEGQYFTYYGRPFGAIDTDVTKTFTNASDTSVGMTIEIIALGEVVNPRISCNSGDQVGWYMELDITMSTGDLVVINTVRGSKSITYNGSTTYDSNPILDYLVFSGTDWLQLETGDNTFSATSIINSERVAAEDVYFGIKYKGRYE